MNKNMFTQNIRILLIVIGLTLSGQYANSQTSIASIGTTLSQNFNSLGNGGGSWTNNTTLTGWYAYNTATPSSYTGNNGTTYTSGALYNFGNNMSANRALGWIPGGTTGSTYGYYGWRLKNNTGTTINTLRVVWTGEQWTKAANADTQQFIRLYYSKGSTVTSLTSGTWTTASSQFQALWAGGASTVSLDGTNAANRTTMTVDIVISGGLAANNEIMLRWDDLKDANNSSMAIDDVSVTAMTNQTIENFNPFDDATYGDTNIQLTAPYATSDLGITYTSSDLNVATISGNTVTIVGPGYTDITASQAGNSAYTAASPVTQSLKVLPKAPYNLTPSNITTSSFTANWNADNGLNDANTRYQLYLSTDPTFPDDNTIIPATTDNKFINIDGLVPGTKYYYRVQSVTVDIYGDFSDAVFFTTTSGIQTYNITASPTFTTATLNWSNGNLTKRAVFVKEGTGAITLPTNGVTYSPILNSNWETKGDQLGSSGYYCVYNGTGTSVYLTHLYPGKTYTVQAYEYQGDPGSEYYLTDVVGANNPITFVPWPSTTWTNSTGISTPEAWNTAARWDHDTIPTKNLHSAVLVYIDGNCEVTNVAETNNLTIKASHNGIIPKLSVNTGQSMNVIGLLTNSGAPSALIIRSAADAPNGTLTFGSGTPQANVEMYSKANWNLSNPVNNKYKWQFFGIPVVSTTAGTTFSGLNSTCYVRKWDETVTDYNGVWVKQNNGTTLSQSSGSILTQNNGYELVQEVPTTYTFSGSLLNSNFTQSLSYTASAAFPGQHIFGNPFTAAVAINQITFGANTEQAIYQYNTGTYIDWTSSNGANSPGSGPGTYTVSTPGTAGSNGVPGQIPSMQGFLVKAINTTGSITLPYSATVTNTTQQRVKAVNSTSDKVSTRIDVIGTNFSDRMWIFSNPTCTRNFDNGWDGKKMLASTDVTQLYGSETDGAYQIDAVNTMNETYLGFQPGIESSFKLVFNHENTATNYSSIYLVDLIANKTVDITASGTEYAFTATASTPATNRFKIVTNSNLTTSVGNQEALKLKIYNSEGAVFVQNFTDNACDFMLYNIQGKVVLQSKAKANGITTIQTLNLIPGVYVAKAVNAIEEAKQRIIIRQN